MQVIQLIERIQKCPGDVDKIFEQIVYDNKKALSIGAE